MDFNDTAPEAEYRAKARAWLEANIGEYREPTEFGRGHADFVRHSKIWQKKKYDAGYTGITWPKSMGGQGLGPMNSIIYNQEESRFHAPTGLYAIGLGMCIPTVFSHGTPELIERYVAKALSGVEVWCQLFSEPIAGSDLAGIRTKAVKDGDTWTIDGQKVWTTNAHLSDFGIIVCRTDPSKPKHKGLTMFIVDMHAPGVEARPLKQMSGGADFNEVFFTNVKVHDSHRVGAEGDGWKVALTTLMNERLAVGGKPSHAPGYKTLMTLAAGIQTDNGPAIAQSTVRERIASTYIADEGIKLTQMRAQSALSRGEMPGPEQSISKVVVAKTMPDLASFAMDLQGAAGVITDPATAEAAGRFQAMWLGSPGMRIAGGTDEILRNIIAERVLGLPGDLRPDKDLPFSQLQG